MPNGDQKPWEKYQAQAGPWTKYQTPATAPQQGTPIPKTSSMQASRQDTTVGSAAMSALKDPFKAFDITNPIENYTQQGRAEHPVLSRVGDVTRNAKELLFGGQEAGKPMGTSSGIANNPVTTAMSLAPGGAQLATKASEALKGGEPLARLNKILGVTAKQIRVGELPQALDELASNPARGVLKSGLTENQLAKMKPIERMQALTKVRNEAGAALDQMLQAHPDKTVNVQKVVEGVFKEIPDPKIARNATTRLQQLLTKAGINKPLSQLNPMEARTVQRELDEFANFAPEGTAKSFRDVATQLRRGISQATRAAVPEITELDQQYGDLAGAWKASRQQVQKYATTVPQSKLRKMMPHLITALGGGATAEMIGRYLVPQKTP